MITEGIGCFVPVYFSWPYIAFGLVPCLLVSFASLGYSGESSQDIVDQARAHQFSPCSTVNEMVSSATPSICSCSVQLWFQHESSTIPEDDLLLCR